MSSGTSGGWLGLGLDLSQPARGPEVMDGECAWEDFHAALEDLALSNRWLGGRAAVIASCGDLVRVAARDGRRPVHVLDVGAGGGDVALALVAWARREHVDVRVTALDSSPHAVRHASQACAHEPTISVVQGDAWAGPPAVAADVVHAGQFLHHVPRGEQAAMLARLAAMASVGAVVSDLVRSPWAWRGVSLFGAVTRRRWVFRHDGPLSVARGFSGEEALQVAAASNVAGLRVTRHPYFRLTWTCGPVPARVPARARR